MYWRANVGELVVVVVVLEKLLVEQTIVRPPLVPVTHHMVQHHLESVGQLTVGSRVVVWMVDRLLPQYGKHLKA
ncbi:UNVERIFIED_CONTAM: hypothetical protein Sradi_4423000 [Sesamum radiatum]|uniref:Secreted protein n=1 Tax=Sesamum radiatum TaxID=300843 RepID=A0AAW2NPW7_SESRA